MSHTLCRQRSLLLHRLSAHSPTRILSPMAHAEPVTGAQLTSSGVIPDVLSLSYSTSSLLLLPVTFPATGAVPHLGNTLTPTLTTPPPTITLPPTLSPTPLYTIIALDPDGPSRRRPRMRSIIHLLRTNVPGTADLTGGEELSEWGPPGPPSSGGLHRYVFLLYQQEGEVDVSGLPGYRGMGQRGKNSAEGLVGTLEAAGGKKLELKAVNWFEAAYDEQVAVNMRQKLGWIAVPLGWLVNWLT